MLIQQLILPIPAVQGGAIETLITDLIEVNEKQKNARFFVISEYDKDASAQKYDNSSIFYFKDGNYCGRGKNVIRLLYKIFQLWYKVTQNRMARKLHSYRLEYMDFLTFQYVIIALVYHINFVCLEGDEHERELSVFNNIVGKEHVFSHIHYTRTENISARKNIGNSISISEYVKDKWVVDKSIPGRNEVLYNGIDLSVFSQTMMPRERYKLRKKYGIKENDFVVLFCGRLLPVKGVEELLDAFDMIDNSQIKLLLVGGHAKSPDSNEAFSIKMLKRASEMKNVVAVGSVSHDAVWKYYAMSEIQVIPSTWQEGAGLVCIEGMAMGLPLIITKSGGMVEYATEKCSIQIPIDDSIANNIADSIQRLANNSDLVKQMRDSGRIRAKQFSRESYYKSFIEIVERSYTT